MFYAHNGANYDNHFIFKMKKLQFSGIVNHGGIMSLSVFDGLFEFRDSMKMTTTMSLAKLSGKDWR